MIRKFRKITIVRINKPEKQKINDELKWFGSSLGLFGLRDKNSSCFRVFIELLKAAKVNHPMSSDEISFRTGLSRGTVVFHLDKLIGAGLVVLYEGKYILRIGNLEKLIDRIKEDTEKVFDDLKEVAHEIDRGLGLEK
jgi:predicted transcriptional regulator